MSKTRRFSMALLGVVPEGTGEARYLFRYFRLPRFPYYYRGPRVIREGLRRAREAFNRSQPLFTILAMPRGAKTRLGVRRLRLPFGRECKDCGGRQMLNLRRSALVRVLQFIEDNLRYEVYFRRTLHPDKGFFTSILGNHPVLRMCNDVLRYIKWPKGIGASSVAVIGIDELDDVFQSSAPFVLKFDMRLEPGTLNRVDASVGIDTVVSRVTSADVTTS